MLVGFFSSKNTKKTEIFSKLEVGRETFWKYLNTVFVACIHFENNLMYHFNESLYDRIAILYIGVFIFHYTSGIFLISNDLTSNFTLHRCSTTSDTIYINIIAVQLYSWVFERRSQWKSHRIGKRSIWVI